MACSEEVVLNKVVASDVVGVALIVSNDYFGSHRVRTSKGIHKESDKLAEVFKKFQYFVYRKQNATREQLQHLCKIFAVHSYPPTCCRLVVAFSGHGVDGRLLCQDEFEINIDEMVGCFTPEVSGKGHMARVFFIDVCCSIQDVSCTTREGDAINCLQYVPKKANILVAYSSTCDISDEYAINGMWMSYLTEELTYSKEELAKSLLNVNKKMRKHQVKGKGFQTTEIFSSLTAEVYLYAEAKLHIFKYVHLFSCSGCDSGINLH